MSVTLKMSMVVGGVEFGGRYTVHGEMARNDDLGLVPTQVETFMCAAAVYAVGLADGTIDDPAIELDDDTRAALRAVAEALKP